MQLVYLLNESFKFTYKYCSIIIIIIIMLIFIIVAITNFLVKGGRFLAKRLDSNGQFFFLTNKNKLW